jgi:hypothetical protein
MFGPDLAAQMGRSAASVYNRRRKLGIPAFSLQA